MATPLKLGSFSYLSRVTDTLAEPVPRVLDLFGGFEHGESGGGFIEYVEVDPRYSFLHEVTHLLRGKVDTDLILPGGVVMA